MADKSRYKTSGLVEAMYEPGSRNRVLKNKPGIKSVREIKIAESEALLKAIAKLAGMYAKSHRFSAKDIQKIHTVWLGEIYDWAGKYRLVNVSKGGFPFAAASQIPSLMIELEQDPLARYTPCTFKAIEETAHAIATVHVELVLIHPFREGNGRMARLLADLMAMQNDLPPLNYSRLDRSEHDNYINAVQAGIEKNYAPMAGIFNGVLSRTLKKRK